MHKSPYNRMWAHHYAISKLGAPVRQKSNTGDPHAVQSLCGGRLLGYLVVHVDVDSRRQATGKIRQVHQVHKRQEGDKDCNSTWFVQRIEKSQFDVESRQRGLLQQRHSHLMRVTAVPSRVRLSLLCILCALPDRRRAPSFHGSAFLSHRQVSLCSVHGTSSCPSENAVDHSVA